MKTNKEINDSALDFLEKNRSSLNSQANIESIILKAYHAGAELANKSINTSVGEEMIHVCINTARITKKDLTYYACGWIDKHFVTGENGTIECKDFSSLEEMRKDFCNEINKR